MTGQDRIAQEAATAKADGESAKANLTGGSGSAAEQQAPRISSAARRRELARPEMLSLLDHLCRDSLEIPLASAQAHPGNGEIHAAFARLAWLIEEVVRA